MLDAHLEHHLRTAARDTGYGAALDLLLREGRPCAYILNDPDLVPDVPEGDDHVPVGASRLGGRPDLPPATPWPKGLGDTGRPRGLASVVAQFRLADLPPVDGLPLPRDGHLALFLRALTDPDGEPRVAAIHTPVHTPAAAAAPLERRTVPARAELVEGELTWRATGLRFVPGVSLPFGRVAFREALDDVPGAPDWGELARAIEPPNCQGQVGGFATDADGRDLCRAAAVAHLGRPDLAGEEHLYDSIAELERSAQRRPDFVRTDDDLAAWLASYDKLRPAVAWVERHREEIADWRLLARLYNHVDVGFDVGDSESLWVFARASDLAAGDFTRLAAACGP